MSNKNDAKVAIITGGSRGIGRAICVELAKDRFYIIINYRSDRSEEHTSELQSH